MATRSNIGILEADGTVKMVYCHWDGYPEHVGRLLQVRYNSEALARSLVALGSLSSLGRQAAPDAGVPHSYQHRAQGVTVAYHRDRGEPLEIQITDRGHARQQGYLYLFCVTDQRWYLEAYEGTTDLLSDVLENRGKDEEG